MEAVRSLKGNKNFLIVAQRVSTIEDCVHLFRLEQGRVVPGGKTEMVLGNVSTMPPEMSHG
jgi:ABC-type multidrug transport system fused ATPase/permease subunit